MATQNFELPLRNSSNLTNSPLANNMMLWKESRNQLDSQSGFVVEVGSSCGSSGEGLPSPLGLGPHWLGPCWESVNIQTS